MAIFAQPFPLAVCSEMVFRDLPITERIKKIDTLGFMAEIWDWTKHDIKALAHEYSPLDIGSFWPTNDIKRNI